MVFVNSKKFACESCIKGHRSSACSHTDRPLFEIKKKGRPISQCEKCRSLRQSRKMHSKCTCSEKEKSKSDVLPLPASAGAKAKRFIPIAPALPNGLKDLQSSSSQCTIALPVDERQRVNTLLNPCTCKNVWRCKCRRSTASSSDNSSALVTLAQAAALRNTESTPSINSSPRSISPPPQPPAKRAKHQHHHTHQKEQHQHHHHPHHARSQSLSPAPPVELPPLLFSSVSPDLSSEAPSTPSIGIPDFGTIPSLSEISSLAGSGCTCGIECNCPGCIQHRGHEHHSPDHGDCPDGCGTCIDNTQGIGLPGLDPPGGSPSIIDRFFARAATLPLPPINRKMGVGAKLDPMNVMVYPKTAIETKERGVPFGLITVPRLECCGGICGCPDGQCSCGKSCEGCCADHNHGKDNQQPEAPEASTGEKAGSEVVAPPPPDPVRSCCSGKVAMSS